MDRNVPTRLYARHQCPATSGVERWQNRAGAQMSASADHAQRMRSDVPRWIRTYRLAMPPALWVRFAAECRAELDATDAPVLEPALLADAMIESAQAMEAAARYQASPSDSALLKLIRETEEEVATDLELLAAARARRMA